MPTSRNAKGVDIVAYSPDGKTFVGIQVKTLSSPSHVPIGKDIEDQKRIWVIVVLPELNSNSNNDINFANTTAYILTNKEINQLKKEYEKDGKKSSWLHKGKYEGNKFKENWSRLDDSKLHYQ